MARIRLGRHKFRVDKDRKRLKEKFHDEIKRVNRKEARRDMARRMDRKALARAFREARVQGKAEREKIRRRYHQAKFEAIQKYDEEISDVEAHEAAETSTLLRIDTQARKDALGKFKRVRRKGKVIALWQRTKVIRRDGRRIRVGIGPFLSVKTVKRSLAATAYWERIRSLARILGLNDSGKDLEIARRADRAMLEVPESERRRIYESIIRKYAG